MWDKDGKCARGKNCPWQGSHGSKPKHDYPSTGDKDDKDDGKDGKFQWSKRIDCSPELIVRCVTWHVDLIVHIILVEGWRVGV